MELESLVTFIRNVCLEAERKDKVDFDRKRYIFELMGMRVWIEDNCFTVEFTLPATSYLPARPVTLRSVISEGASPPLF
jgi:tRNA(Glu) U13 pseudouridine synthase TruD